MDFSLQPVHQVFLPLDLVKEKLFFTVRLVQSVVELFHGVEEELTLIRNLLLFSLHVQVASAERRGYESFEFIEIIV